MPKTVAEARTLGVKRPLPTRAANILARSKMRNLEGEKEEEEMNVTAEIAMAREEYFASLEVEGENPKAVKYRFVDETVMEDEESEYIVETVGETVGETVENFEETVTVTVTKSETAMKNKKRAKEIKPRKFEGKKAEQEKHRAFKELTNTIKKKLKELGPKLGVTNEFALFIRDQVHDPNAKPVSPMAGKIVSFLAGSLGDQFHGEGIKYKPGEFHIVGEDTKKLEKKIDDSIDKKDKEETEEEEEVGGVGLINGPENC